MLSTAFSLFPEILESPLCLGWMAVAIQESDGEKHTLGCKGSLNSIVHIPRNSEARPQVVVRMESSIPR